MKAMVFAAGLGTRLRPLTDNRPKALVEIAGRTLLALTLSRLRAFGVNEVIINTHHFADAVAETLRANNGFGMRVEISREDTLLDTGGGLKKAAWFFLESDEPFIAHNVDLISTLDLHRMKAFHATNDSLVTLAVRNRQTSRYLLFDENLQLCGRGNRSTNQVETVHAAGQPRELAFSGIHIISPRALEMMPASDGPFSIIDFYLELAKRREKISAFVDDASYWRDLGRPEDLAKAASEVTLWRPPLPAEPGNRA